MSLQINVGDCRWSGCRGWCFSWKRGTQIVNQQTFERDALGNKIRITSSRGVANFTYDQDSQLKTATNTEATTEYQNESFNYDTLGNRTNDQLGAYAYHQKKSRLMEDYRYFYSYDNNGNLITRTAKGLSGTVTNFVYSSENQLTEVHQTEGFVQTKSSYYAYDAVGRRTKKTVIDHLDGSKSFERRYVFDGNERLADYDHDNSVLAVHTHSSLRTDDTLSTQVTPLGVTGGVAQASGSFFYLKDSLGTITDVVDGTGNLVQHYVYSSFGKILKITDQAEQTTTTPLLRPDYSFTNRELDEETGLYYYRARYYVPELGRFLTEDPDNGSTGRPSTTFQKYSYAGNNPGKYVDPTGEVFGLLQFASLALTVFGKGQVQEYAADLLLAQITGALIVFSGGTASGAISAVASTAAGSGLAAGASSMFAKGDFNKNFHSFFRVSTSFLAMSALLAPGGVASAGGNGIQGYVKSANPYFGGGTGLTIGSASTHSLGSGLIYHEISHTVQFIAFSSFFADPNETWRFYGAFTGVGAFSRVIGIPDAYNVAEFYQ